MYLKSRLATHFHSRSLVVVWLYWTTYRRYGNFTNSYVESLCGSLAPAFSPSLLLTSLCRSDDGIFTSSLSARRVNVRRLDGQRKSIIILRVSLWEITHLHLPTEHSKVMWIRCAQTAVTPRGGRWRWVVVGWQTQLKRRLFTSV